MTKTYKDLLRQIMVALEYASAYTPSDECPCCICEAITALQEAIDAPDPEPSAWMIMNGVCSYQLMGSKKQADALCAELQKRHDLSGSFSAFHVVPLYLHPQQ